MAKYKIFIGLMLLLTHITYGQQCDCDKNYKWVKKTFEENDAGYRYVLERKGLKAYEQHNDSFTRKIKSVDDLQTCTQLLYEWLGFFRTEHIGIRRLISATTAATKASKAENKTKRESINVAIADFERYLNNKKEADYEGIWETAPYKIGIKKAGETYWGFLIETGNVEGWEKGQIKLKLEPNGKGLKSTFYLRDKHAESYPTVELIGKNYLQIGRFRLKRVYPQYPIEQDVEQYFKLMAAPQAYLEELNATTLLLRIPTFDNSAKKDIESLIATHKDKILKTENLIIDIRGNMGGDNESFDAIIPLLYTNPIRTVGIEYLSTKLNNRRMLDMLNNPELTLNEREKKWLKDAYQNLEQHLDSFVNLEPNKISIKQLNNSAAYPKNIGIIINEENGGSAEQFLLAAKQSKKVKLFGSNTFGALDISNMYFVISPCKEFELGYCVSRSMRIPEMSIDNKGIQPDYYLDKSVPAYQWLTFVNNILNGK